jgi:hypothetical protein
MQSFVRQVDPVTREIAFQDVPQKEAIVKQMSKVKLEVFQSRRSWSDRPGGYHFCRLFILADGA